ncbi:MAG: peptidase [Oscillospiraceae bacterium]|nr:peptidase [Oscillospiraceae bacterium]
MSIKKRRTLKAVSATIVMAIAFVFSFNVFNIDVTASSVADLQSKYDKLEEQQKAIKSQMQQTQKDQTKEEEYQKQLDSQIEVTQNQISILNTQITEINKEIDEKEVQIKQKEEDIKVTYDQFKQRLRAMYMSSDPSMLSMLLGATDMSDFLTRIEIVKRVSNHDQKLISKLKKEKSAIETAKARVEADKEKVSAARANLASKKSSLDLAYQKSKSAINELKLQEEEYKANAAEIDKQMKEAEEEIQRQIAAHQSDGEYVGGEFLWPLPGYSTITSGFGSRWGTTHKGIDISGGGVYGKTIVAANSGTVITAITNDKPGYSYGKYVIIDHGGGKSTLYGHCSALLVSVGEHVERGQAIAKVGSTGWSTGPHLHFEVRINGQAQNPLGYLKR